MKNNTRIEILNMYKAFMKQMSYNLTNDIHICTLCKPEYAARVTTDVSVQVIIQLK
jgi:hypothetical protein